MSIPQLLPYPLVMNTGNQMCQLCFVTIKYFLLLVDTWQVQVALAFKKTSAFFHTKSFYQILDQNVG